MATNDDSRRARLLELASLFLRLGLSAFGGPAAHVAMMEQEVVRRRKWLSSEEFLDFLGATNLIPGPNSTEMAMHVGHKRAGAAGLCVAGVCFILPAAAITLAVSWAYVRFGTLPSAGGLLYGVKPVMIGVVVQALVGLARSAVKDVRLGVIGALAIVAVVLGVEELLVLFVAGAVGALSTRKRRDEAEGSGVAAIGGAGLVAAASAPAGAVTSWSLFLVFAKIGAVLFGSGYVLLAFLRAELVEQRGWMTEAQLVDAIAVGQITPGPVFTTATFVGYVVNGYGGAAAATVGIFLPAFLFVAASGRLVPKLRASTRASGFLDGVNVASLALMAVVTVQLGRAALVDAVAVGIGVVAAVLLVRFKVSSVWLVAGGAACGLVVSALR